MKQFNKLLAISAVAIALVLSNLYFYAGYKVIKNQLTQKDLSYKQLEENFKALRRNYELLSKESESLQSANLLLKDESNVMQLQMKSSKAEMEKAAEQLNNFEQTIKSSLSWFKRNTNIKEEEEYDLVRTQLKECLKKKGECTIDLSCIFNINKRNGIYYTDDLAMTGKDDFLKNLSLIYKQKGGDCEDFSLLFNAEYNYLADDCLQNYSRSNITPAVEGKELEGSYMYIVCGGFDPGKIVTDWAGHCMVAVSEYAINSSFDAYYGIKDSQLVEPQNGRYMGQVGKTDLTYIFNSGVFPSTLYRIDMVITPNDLYIYYAYDQEIKWMGYEDFLEKVQPLKDAK